MTDQARTPLLPLMLDVTALPIFVVGNGKSAAQRMVMLDEHGADQVHIFSTEPTPEVRTAAHSRLITRWPTADDFRDLRPHLVFVADTPIAIARELATLGATNRALVHVQDDIPLCRFHLPARLRRGQLLVTVSTDGAAAGFSRLLRDYLASTVLGPEWAGRMEEISAARRSWKQNGLSGEALFSAIRTMCMERRWFPAFFTARDTEN